MIGQIAITSPPPVTISQLVDHSLAEKTRMDAGSYEEAKERAKELLRSVISENEWLNLQSVGYILYVGKRARYAISPHLQTGILNLRSGRHIADACLQLSIPAPAYDRMIAEYLLLRNDENLYWKTANIFERRGVFSFWIFYLIILFDVTVFANLLRELL